MILIPAIDIKDGKVVRLFQGKFDKVTEYSGKPSDLAKHWQNLGAQRLHVVDLDGAQSGELKNPETIFEITNAVNIPVQVGGGIRGADAIGSLLNPVAPNKKVDRVILGTSAALDADRENLKAMIQEWKGRVAVSIDCKEGFVALRGWTEKSNIKGVDLAKEMESIGISCLIYTDIARDGMLTGPNFEGLKEILKTVQIPVIASGGIATIKDVERLLVFAKQYENLVGAITGKAIYEETLNFKEAVELCSQSG